MSIIPDSPIPRTAIARWEIDAFSARIDARTVVLVYVGYDSDGNRVATLRFELSDSTTPNFAAFVAACPAAPTFKRQIEAFGAQLAALLAGTVS